MYQNLYVNVVNHKYHVVNIWTADFISVYMTYS
jgi:hypothetical protein